MQVRAHPIQALHAELVGPYDLDANAAEEVLSPSRRCLTAFLSPLVLDALMALNEVRPAQERRGK